MKFHVTYLVGEWRFFVVDPETQAESKTGEIPKCHISERLGGGGGSLFQVLFQSTMTFTLW